MYADITDIADITRLQAALDRMVQWAEAWQLKLSIDKCCVLHIDNSRQFSHQYCIRYTPTLSVIISFLLSHTVVI